MQNELTCNQVIALMSFYVEDKLNAKLKEYVENHLIKCSKCREIYMHSEKIAQHIMNLTCTNSNIPFATKRYEDFKDNLSAYVDNELDENESIRIKKIAISNPMARKDLENMYAFKKLLNASFDKTRSEWKNDYSKIVMNKLHKIEYANSIDPFYKIIGAFSALIFIMIAGFAIALHL